ncbi:hypothetical protein [Xanthomonas arboricola]|uniref:hypothetical protein n=1 Tax=Xanthomonas arboricola TaxID=56448 RepID=UPI0012DB3B52
MTLPCTGNAGPLTVAMHEHAGMFELDMPLCGHGIDSVHHALPACCCTCAFGSRAAFEPRLRQGNQNSGNPVSMPQRKTDTHPAMRVRPEAARGRTPW